MRHNQTLTTFNQSTFNYKNVITCNWFLLTDRPNWSSQKKPMPNVSILKYLNTNQLSTESIELKSTLTERPFFIKPKKFVNNPYILNLLNKTDKPATLKKTNKFYNKLKPNHFNAINRRLFNLQVLVVVKDTSNKSVFISSYAQARILAFANSYLHKNPITSFNTFSSMSSVVYSNSPIITFNSSLLLGSPFNVLSTDTLYLLSNRILSRRLVYLQTTFYKHNELTKRRLYVVKQLPNPYFSFPLKKTSLHQTYYDKYFISQQEADFFKIAELAKSNVYQNSSVTGESFTDLLNYLKTVRIASCSNGLNPFYSNLHLRFIRRDRQHYTKLKYSRTQAYDIVSGGSAALLAALFGFLITEKFGFELPDSGDFYFGLMYVIFLGWSLVLLRSLLTHIKASVSHLNSNTTFDNSFSSHINLVKNHLNITTNKNFLWTVVSPVNILRFISDMVIIFIQTLRKIVGL